MSKKYGIYSGLFAIDFIAITILLVIFYYTLISFQNSTNFLIFIFVLIAIILLELFITLRHFTYKITIEDHKIKESGILSLKRELDINSVKFIDRTTYHLFEMSSKERISFINRIIISILSKGKINPFSYLPMIIFKGTFSADIVFPSHPINPKIIETLVNDNPSIKVDKNLADLIPVKLREQLNIKMSVTDKAGLWLWRILILILILVVVFPLALVLFFRFLGS